MKIKYIFNLITLLLLLLIGIFAYYKLENKDIVNKKEFNDYETEFNRRLDSVDLVIKFIKCDTDTLKKGQIIIYKEVKKVNSKNWYEIF